MPQSSCRLLEETKQVCGLVFRKVAGGHIRGADWKVSGARVSGAEGRKITMKKRKWGCLSLAGFFLFLIQKKKKVNKSSIGPSGNTQECLK